MTHHTHSSIARTKKTSINKIRKSPEQLVMSCCLRTLLPTLHHLLYQYTENPSEVWKRYAECQNQQQKYYNGYMGKEITLLKPDDRNTCTIM